MEDIIIVGGGIGGLALAAGLSKKGKKVIVLEAAPRLRPLGAGILLAHNAQKALEHVGALETTWEKGHVLSWGDITDNKGKVLGGQATPQGYRPWLSIHRGMLQQSLLQHLDANHMHLNARVQHVAMGPGGVQLTTTAGHTWEALHVIAFDGIHSHLRAAVGDTRPLRYAGYTCWRGIAHHTPTQPDHFTELWGHGLRFGIVPISATHTYWFACANAPARSQAMQAYGPPELARLFADFTPQVKSLINSTPKENIYWNDIEDLKPAKQLAYGPVLLAGDAGHPTTPNMGQGAGMALEDAATLTTLLSHDLEWPTLTRLFEQRRLQRTAWITNTSWQMGKMGQWQHPLAVRLRNGITRATPSSAAQRMLRKLGNVTFER